MNDFSQFFQQLMQMLPQGQNPMYAGGSPGFREGPMSAPMYDPAGAGGAQAPMGQMGQMPQQSGGQSAMSGMNPMLMQFLQQMVQGGGFGGQQQQPMQPVQGTMSSLPNQLPQGQTLGNGFGGQMMYAGGSPTFQEGPFPLSGTGAGGMPDPNATMQSPQMPAYPGVAQSSGQASPGAGNWMNMISGVGAGAPQVRMGGMGAY